MFVVVKDSLTLIDLRRTKFGGMGPAMFGWSAPGVGMEWFFFSKVALYRL